MDDELRKLLEDLTRRQKGTLEALEKVSKHRKTLWDYLQPAVLVTLIGVVCAIRKAETTGTVPISF